MGGRSPPSPHLVKPIIRLVKWGSFGGTVFVAGVVLALLLAYVAQIPQKALAQIVSQEMSKIFKQPVRIGSVKGNFVTGISLRDLQFFNPPDMTRGVMLEIARADVRYNLMDAFRHKGDILAATHLVTLSGVRLKILRDKNDKWNVFSLAPPPDPNLPPAPLTFKGIIRMSDMGIAFVDEKGWGPKALSVPFSDVFSPVTGFADFADISQAQLRLQGRLASNDSPVSLVGSLDVNTGQFRMLISMKSFNFKRWEPYILPFPGLDLQGETVDIDMYLRSKYFPEKGQLPFFFDIKTTLKETSLKLPVFSEPIQNITGTVRMTNSLVRPIDLAQSLGISVSSAQEIMDYLKAEGILDPKNRVDATVVSTMPPLMPLVLPKKWAGYTRRLHAFLNSPDVRLVGGDVSAELVGATLSGSGYLILNKGLLDFDLVTTPFPARSLVRLFPALASWKLSGTGQGSVRVTGEMSNPKVEGRMRSERMRVRGILLSEPVLDYRYHTGVLHLGLLSGRVYGTAMTGEVTTTFGPKGPLYQGEMALSWLQVGQGGFGLTFAEGHAALHATFSGNTTSMDVQYQVPTATVTAWQQRVTGASGHMAMTFSPLQYEVLSGEITLNERKEPVPIRAMLRPGDQWWVSMDGRLRLYDPLSRGMTGPLSVRGRLSANWPSPHSEIWSSLSGNLVVSAEGFPFLGRHYDDMSVVAEIQNGRTQIHQFFLENGEEKAAFSGSLDRMVVTDGTLSLFDFYLDAEALHLAMLPQKMKPMTGRVTGVFRFSQPEKQGKPSWKDSHIDVDATFKDGRVQNQALSFLGLKGHWGKGKMTFSDIRLRHHSSVLNARAILQTDGVGAIHFLSGTVIQLADFQSVLYDRVGPLTGAVAVTGMLSGALRRPEANLSVAISGFKSYAFGLNDISGQLLLRNGVLSITEGRVIENKSKMGFSGHVQLWGETPGPRYAWRMSFKETPLEALAVAIEALRKEMNLRKVAATGVVDVQERVKQPNMQIAPSVFSIQDPYLVASGNKTIYQTGGGGSIQFYQEVNRRYQYAQRVPDLGLRRLVSGRLSGDVDIVSADGAIPKLNMNLHVLDAVLGGVRTSDLLIEANSQDKGLTFSFQTKAGDMGGTPFEYLRFGGRVDNDGVLFVTQSEVASQGRKNKQVISGTFPLSAFWDPKKADIPIDIEMRWDGDELNVLTVFNPYLSRLSNKGRIVLSLKGTVREPLLSTKEMILKDAVIFLNSDMTPFLSGLRIDDKSVIQIKDNVMKVSPLIVYWEGVDTQPLHSSLPRKNVFDIQGEMTIRDLSLNVFDKVSLDFNLRFNTTDISVNLNKIYQGNLRLEKMSFQGVYEIPISHAEKAAALSRQGTESERGPLLSGEAYLSQGILSLPTLGEKRSKPAILFNVAAYIRDNMAIDGSLVGEGLLGSVTNKFHLELAESIQPLRIGGGFNALKIRNPVFLKSGYVLMLNRSFDMLSLEGQRVYYRDTQYRVHENSVVFQTVFSSGKARLIPYFNVTAVTVISPKIPLGTTVSLDAQVNPDDSKYSHVLVTLSGSAYELQNFLFEKYMSEKPDVSDGGDYRSSYRLAGGANQSDTVEVLRLLAPQVFDVADSGDSRSNDTFWQDIGSSQINLIFNSALRPIETDLARNVGLNDIRFDYNVGDALFNNFSDKTVGINFVKSWFSNQLYLRVKTSVDLERKNQTEAVQVSELELTYFFEKYFSVNATNFRKDVGTYRNKYSVKYSNDF